MLCSFPKVRSDPFLPFFLYDHLCDWELEEIELDSLLTGLVSCPHPWRGGAGLGQVSLHYGVPYTGLLRHVFMALMGVGQVSCS